MKNDSHKCKLTVFSFHLIFFLSDRSHCLLMFDAVNKTSNDMELSLCVGNCNESNSGKCWIFHLLGFCCCNSLIILIFFVFWSFFAVEGELTSDGAMNIQGNDKNRWEFFFFFFFFSCCWCCFLEVNHGIYGYFVPLLQDNDEFAEIYFTSVW